MEYVIMDRKILDISQKIDNYIKYRNLTSNELEYINFKNSLIEKELLLYYKINKSSNNSSNSRNNSKNIESEKRKQREVRKRKLEEIRKIEKRKIEKRKIEIRKLEEKRKAEEGRKEKRKIEKKKAEKRRRRKIEQKRFSEDVCITSAATKDYMNRMITLYNSLRRNCSKKIYFHAHLININKNNYFSKKKDKYLEITHSEIKTKANNVIRAYASNVRARLLNECIQHHDKVFWFDADSIVRRDLRKLFSYLDNNFITVHKFRNRHNRIKSGIVGFKKCELCIKFLKKWDRETFRRGIYKCHWYQDQHFLNNNLRKIKFHNFPFSYIDWNFKPNSHIWVGKGNRKNKRKYRNEERKFT